MHNGPMWFLGMHVFWWIVWAVLLVWAYRWATSSVKRQETRGRETPLEVLQRSYAVGDLSSQEYEDRKAKLMRDREVR